MTEESSRRVARAGAIALFGAIWGILSILVAESLTPGYDVSTETVSGLGAPYFSGICNALPNCAAPIQPASAVIVFSFFLGGALILWSGYLLRTATRHKLFGLGIAVIGALELVIGVSYVPLYLGVSSAGGVGAAYDLHISGAIPFFFLATALAISSFRVTRGLFRYFGLVMGLVALAAILLFVAGTDLGLGRGGMERMIIYPVLLWTVGLGTYLLGGKLD